MRWWSVKQQQPPPTEAQGHEEKKSKSGKSKASFSLLAWFSRLTAKHNAAASSGPKHAAAEAKTCGGGFPSRSHERATPTPTPSPTSQSSLADTLSPTAEAADTVPRRLSVGNDDADAAAAATAARQLYRRRHYSVGGHRDLPPLRHLIAFSRTASPLTPVLTSVPSDTDEEKRLRSRQRRRRASGRRSFSGRTTPGARLAAVRVRSPRCAVAAVSGLERFAVVRRTSDPQREFRDSMVEMIASKRIGRPEELETLLACYLSLNADEHHDCIVKVFRQVWFELNPARIATVTSRPRS